MKKYDIEIIFKDDMKEIIHGYEDNKSGLEIIKSLFADLDNTKYIVFDVKNDVYLYYFNDIKHLKILEID